MTMTLEEARLLAGVNERAKGLYADGYTAEVIHEYAVHVTNPHGTVYTVDPVNETCTCPFFTKWENRYPCKHLLGWRDLMQAQLEATNPFQDTLFCLGRVVATPNALKSLESNGQQAVTFLLRHASGDWGDLDDHDKRANDRDLRKGGRLLSAYHLADTTTLWIATEWNRTITTILLPEEY